MRFSQEENLVMLAAETRYFHGLLQNLPKVTLSQYVYMEDAEHTSVRSQHVSSWGLGNIGVESMRPA